MTTENTPAGTPAAPEGTTTIGDNPGTDPKGTLPIEPKAKETEPEAGPAPVVYEPTGDVALDMALEFVGKFGIDPTDPVMVAAGEGNFALLEAKLAAFGDKAKGYEKFIALGKSAYANVEAKQKAEHAKKAELIHKTVGGEEQWKAIQTWAGANAEPEEQAAVNAALNAGGTQAKAMALYLSMLYEKAGGVTVRGKPAVGDGAGSGGTPNSGALAPRPYTVEVEKLRRQLGSKMESSPQYKQLQQRRMAWKG